MSGTSCASVFRDPNSTPSAPSPASSSGPPGSSAQPTAGSGTATGRFARSSELSSRELVPRLSEIVGWLALVRIWTAARKLAGPTGHLQR